jgi:polar amino acid transport system substrate-binding protein
MKKITLLFLLALAVILQPSAQAETKTLRWAAATDSNAPYAFYGPGNKLTGFEYEVIQAIAREMGREPVFVPNDWDGLIPGLGRGLYDCVICGIEITTEKAQEVLFTNPYYVTYEQFVVKNGTGPVTSLEELKGKPIGTLSQTASFNMLSKTPGVIVKTYDEEVNAYADVANGRLFGVLLDYPIAKYYAFANPNLKFTGPPFGQITYGIAIAKGNSALAAEMNEALARVISSGHMRDILSRWGLWTAMVADTFSQPEEPSLPDTEYRAFVAATAEQPSLVSRIIGYARFWPLLLEASLLTIEVSLLGMVGAVLLGFTLAIMRVYGPFPVRWIATLYIELVRGTPLLIQLLILFYGLPNIGIKLEPFVAGVLGLALNYAAYEAENYRAGLLAIPKGQMEAARALGMTQRQGLVHVVIPQSFRLVLPPVTNDFISLLKDSSLVSMVTLVDLTGAYKQIATQTFDYFGAGLLIAAFYLLIGLPFVRLARYTEQRLNPGAHSSGTKGARFQFGFGKS